MTDLTTLEARSAAILAAFTMLADNLCEQEEEQTAGEAEGIYEEEEGERVFERIEGNRASLALAREALAMLTAPRVIGISLEGGLVQNVFCPDPAGLAYVVIDYDTDGQDLDDVCVTRQHDGDWARCYGHCGNVSRAPEMLVVPDPLGRSFDGPLVNLSFADRDGGLRELSFTLPASLAAAAHDEAEGVALALDDCASKIDVKVTHAPAVSPLLTPRGLEG